MLSERINFIFEVAQNNQLINPKKIIKRHKNQLNLDILQWIAQA